MAKKKSSHRSKKMTVPVAVAAPLVLKGVEMGKALTVAGQDKAPLYVSLGLNGTGGWYWPNMVKAWAPTVLGTVIHYGANRFGVNRILSNAKIPLIRI